MNKIIFIAICLLSFTTYSQVTDTVEVGFYKSVYLMFSDKPEVIDAGSEHLSVRNQDNLVILQILNLDEWEQTNLFVQNNGIAYYFIIDYKEHPTKTMFNYSVRANNTTTQVVKGSEEIIGTSPVVDSNVMVTPTYYSDLDKKTSKEKQDSIYYLNCLDVINRKDRIGNRGVVKYRMGYFLRDIVIINEKVYLKFEVKNKSNISFNRDLEMYNVINVKRRIKGTPEQLIELTTIYQHQAPSKFEGNKSYEYVVVLDKFVLTADKKLQIQLWEQNGQDLDDEGGRKLVFDVFFDDVLNSNQ